MVALIFCKSSQEILNLLSWPHCYSRQYWMFWKSGVLTTIIPALTRLRQKNCHKFKVSVVYRVRPVPPKKNYKTLLCGSSVWLEVFFRNKNRRYLFGDERPLELAAQSPGFVLALLWRGDDSASLSNCLMSKCPHRCSAQFTATWYTCNTY